METPYHTLSPDKTFKQLHTSKEGLTHDEAKKRLKEFGPNTLQIKSTETIPRILLRQLQNPIVYLLLASTFIALILGKFIDGAVIFSVVILNTLIGFIQEYRANKIIRALSAMVPHNTVVIRQGETKLIHSSQVVPGDIVSLQSGDKISADMRLFFIKNLQCDEATLTGESLPVNKKVEAVNEEATLNSTLGERKCMAFSGTYVTSGTALGIVVATGTKTEFGKISEMIEQISPLETPLTVTFRKITSWITGGVIIVGIFLFIIGYLRNYSFYDSALSAVALAVAAIPEGLPAIITIASAIGVRRMAKRKAIIRQLPAVEALGSTTVICTDKTGTLTLNEMTVQRLWTHGGFSYITGLGFSSEGKIIPPKSQKIEVSENEIDELLKAAVLCSDATINDSEAPVGDPTEVALIVAAKKGGVDVIRLREDWPREDAIPFEPSKKLMATLNSSSSKKVIFLKGAPEEIISRCEISNLGYLLGHFLKHVNEMAKEGLRVLAVAKKEVSYQTTIQDTDLKQGFTLLGLVGMIDPPRKEVYSALKSCFTAGIDVKMITGDHPVTAEAISKDLGILANTKVLTGSELNTLNAYEWKIAAKKHNVFARTSPEHKLKLVDALQQLGHVVAMTGDGVNDAPALKKADIGVAMGIKGTAVAKEASDMILADDNFASIEASVEEGRRVYDNLVKAFAFVLPTSLAQALVILIAVVFFPIKNNVLMQPILPVQILWINLVVAVALALPLAFEAPEPDIMKRPPRKKGGSIFSLFIVIRTFTVSLVMALGTIALFLWVINNKNAAIMEAQTIAVTTIIFFQIFYLLNCRSLKYSIFKMGFLSNPMILLGIGVVILSQLAFVYLPFMQRLFHSIPLTWEEWLLSAVVGFFMFPVIAFEKIVNRYFFKKL